LNHVKQEHTCVLRTSLRMCPRQIPLCHLEMLALQISTDPLFKCQFDSPKPASPCSCPVHLNIREIFIHLAWACTCEPEYNHSHVLLDVSVLIPWLGSPWPAINLSISHRLDGSLVCIAHRCVEEARRRGANPVRSGSGIENTVSQKLHEKCGYHMYQVLCEKEV
jgi:hypothetical protein